MQSWVEAGAQGAVGRVTYRWLGVVQDVVMQDVEQQQELPELRERDQRTERTN